MNSILRPSCELKQYQLIHPNCKYSLEAPEELEGQQGNLDLGILISERKYFAKGLSVSIFSDYLIEKVNIASDVVNKIY